MALLLKATVAIGSLSYNTLTDFKFIGGLWTIFGPKQYWLGIKKSQWICRFTV
jgi:hypothetical protein